LHNIFQRDGTQTFVIPVHGNKVKPFYVKQIEAAIWSLKRQSDDEDKA